MSEGDVSMIRDEDVLRRMWQQTEDFSRKKEIRAHMYRLREERLRNLYSPDPTLGKGVESAMHVTSLQDQSFQTLKSKEVRDAGSPPKDYCRPPPDLKELSNAGWNVESENKTTDDGHTKIHAIHADIQGKYDVEGGQGQFSAVDSHRQAHTEYQDGNTSVKKDEARSKTASTEKVVRKTDDGTQFSSTQSSSTSSSSKFQQVSSSSSEVPYITQDESDSVHRDTSSNREFTRNVTNTSDYEKTLRKNDYASGELISRKVDYPDDNTKVIVETRCLPDGTRVTSTRKEFRAPVQSTRSEQHSSRSESKSYSTSSHHADSKESTKTTQQYDIVDAQRQADDYDFKRNRIQYQDDSTQTQRKVQQVSDTSRYDARDTSTKITRESVDRHQDISETQRRHDDYDYKRNIQIDSTRNDDTTSTNKRHETKINETNHQEYKSTDDKRNVQTDYSTIQHTNRYDTKVDDSDHSEKITSRDDQHIQRDVKETQYVKNNEERIHNIVEKNVKDQYQTTYQTDYTQKRISNDLSPTHQAWASTLRADTPATSRPTTRASSPGSRTYQSSTSSLRSSVSPDKTTRKPPSRGGSPNKTNRSSPSRHSTDRYSSTTSTRTFTETHDYKHSSPDRKPPVSPTRHGSSPDRKSEGYRQRPSQSPEKRPQGYSPDRKQTEDFPRTVSPTKPVYDTVRSSTSPDKKQAYQPFDSFPRTTSPNRSNISPEKKLPDRPRDVPFSRPSASPERKLGSKSTSSPSTEVPSYRPGTSPDRKSGFGTSPTRSSPGIPGDKHTKESSPTRPSDIPDSTPSYMRPTAASKTHNTSGRKSPAKNVPSSSPERKTSGKTVNKQEHYRFIDEETKMYTRTDRDDIRFTKRRSPSTDRPEFSGPRDRSPSPDRRSPDDVPDYARADSPSLRSSLRNGRSPSPPKGPVTFTQDHVDRTETIKTSTTDINSRYEDIAKTYRTSKPRDSPTRDVPREPSPSKYGTYDKKHRSEETEEVITSITRSDDIDKYDSLTLRDKTTKSSLPTLPTKTMPGDKRDDSSREPSPSKYGTYDKKRRAEECEEMNKSIRHTTDDDTTSSLTRIKSDSPRKAPEYPSAPKRETPRSSVSPTKLPTKDVKYKNTTDFIATERINEEINKRTTKDRSRQLITPSTSPTRKPKVDDTAPSTGQSSPTTSASGFVYFSSPKVKETIVTDLDDEVYFSEINKTEEFISTQDRPQTLNIERSPSPSKIPCRSPSVDKKTPIKESLPRKSSLKKPSSDRICLSPEEKPPSSFRISPTDEPTPEHKVIKKDRPDKPVDTPVKPKAPFERRETYEERCLKILGVVEDNKETLKRETNQQSPSVSPCRSPDREVSPSKTFKDKKETKISVTNFITKEQEDTIKKTTTRFEGSVTTNRKSKTPSRENSPTKLQDIMAEKTIKKEDVTEDVESKTISKKVRVSPDRDIGYQKPRSSISPENVSPQYPKDSTIARPSQSPDRKIGTQVPAHFGAESPRTTSPTRPLLKDGPMKSNPSPDRKLGYSKATKPTSGEPTKKSPTRSPASPDRKPGYMRSTASTTHKYETHEASEDVQETIIRHSLDRETGYQKTKESPIRPSSSPEREPGYDLPTPTGTALTRSSVSPDRKPNYMRPTASTVMKYDETSVEEVEHKRIKEAKDTHSISHTSEKSTSKLESPSKKPEEPRLSRSPSPPKKTLSTEATLLIQSEREREVFDRVQESLRKLSPTRDHRSPSREKSPGKPSISLQDIDVVTSDVKHTVSKTVKEDDQKITQKESTIKYDATQTVKTKDDKPKEKPASKVPSRTVSPTKKPASPSDSSPSDKSRSISPKKPFSSTERSQSPQISKPSGIKPREPTPSSLTRKQSGNVSPTKTDSVSTEVKKTTNMTKQNSVSRIATATKTTTSKVTSTTNKIESEPKRALIPKGINKENVSPRKEDVKVTRTASDTSLKNKKASPQRMKSKPEIQVHDLSPTRTPKSSMLKKPSGRETPSKLAPKPKSATALNSTLDDDEIIVDIEQAKSSRENSPDRICPTPVNFGEDVGTPRFPDEVHEPDDEFRARTHHIIHETESIVDDIVEISEDDELFVKKTDSSHVTESDECLLSVTDKVSKFTNKIDTITKPNPITAQFKDTERRVHSDFIDEKLKSDECLLSVSEKVNKFAKGPQNANDKTSSRKITDEYDTQTVYQDDYTKLSVNDKAHLFIETAENAKSTKTKPTQKVERPDLSNVDEDLKSDDCLLSVSDKVHKFVKTAEQFLQESQESEEKDRKVREEYEKFMKHISQEDVEDTEHVKTTTKLTEEQTEAKTTKVHDENKPSFTKETTSSHTKVKDYASPNLKPVDKTPIVKITTLRSSEAVKKAKAMFENIASTTQQTKETKATRLLDIGVTKKSPKTDSTTVLHPSVEDLPLEPENLVDGAHKKLKKEYPSSETFTRLSQPRTEEKPRSSYGHRTTQSPEPRTDSPIRHTTETSTTTTKTVLSRFPAANNETPKRTRPEIEKTPRRTPEPRPSSIEPEKVQEKIPSYQRPTANSLIKEEKTIEESEVTTRRGSGKFGVELRRTSVERSTISSERRRSSTEHHPAIEDIFDLDLLEQMLEKVSGYEQRRRIRAQIRVARKHLETERTDTSYTRNIKHTTTTKTSSPERRLNTKSPERQKTSPSEHRSSTPQKPSRVEQDYSRDQTKPLMNGHAKEPSNLSEKRQRPKSPEKPRQPSKTKSPVRQPSPEKRTRMTSPTKMTPKPKSNRFSEYASAYIKKVGLNETDKVKLFDRSRRTQDTEDQKTKQFNLTTKKSNVEDKVTSKKFEEHKAVETKTLESRNFTERTSSKDNIEIVHVNGKRSPSPEKKRSPVHHAQSPSDRLYQRSPSPDFKRKTDINRETIIKTVYESEPKVTKKETIIKTVVEERPKVDISKKETIIKTVYDIEKKSPKQAQEEKPSWVTNRNLKKVTSENRTFSAKKTEEKKSRTAESPGKALTRPIDAVVSSYGPGPLDADGRPLFGIKALRNGSSNYQVKGTVIRQEFHSRNGGEPEGTVSVTAYSTQPEDLERLLKTQGEKPSRIHGLAAITTTKKFGGESGTTLNDAHNKEERAVLDHFTHSDRRAIEVDDSKFEREERVNMRESKTEIESRKEEDKRRTEERRERVERREDKKTVRQSSVKSLTEKYIKSASDTCKSERVSYPKAGLILRTANLKDSVSSDSSAHAELGRTNSAHSLGSVEDNSVVTTRTTQQLGDGVRTTTTTTRKEHRAQEHRGQEYSSQEHRTQERSFLDSSTKVSGVQDILTRMRNADIVIEDGDTTEDTEARALLNKFLGASVLMAGMQGYIQEKPTGHISLRQETSRSSNTGGRTTTVSSRRVEEIDLEQCWDEQLLRKLLEESSDYDQRRRIRARIRNLMAEQEACASAVTEALAASGGPAPATDSSDAREEEEVTVTSSVRKNSSEKIFSSSSTTKTSKVIESIARPAPKPVSPFAKFRQLEKQNSTNSPNSPQTPQSPGSPAKTPYFKFTDPALQASAMTIKERLLQWCRDKTRDYENVKLENFSTSWADGLAFCALIHHFLPDAFDYSQLSPKNRRHNFTLAFKVADEKAGIYPLLDVDDMVAMRKPDWKCVFTYVQAIHRRFKDQS